MHRGERGILNKDEEISEGSWYQGKEAEFNFISEIWKLFLLLENTGV